MAEVADFHHIFADGFEEEEDGEIETLESVPSWLQEFEHEDINPSDSDSDPDPFFPRSTEFTLSSDLRVDPQNVFDEDEIKERGRTCIEIAESESDSVSEFNYFTRQDDDEVNLVDDLFERSNERSDGVVNEDFLSIPFAEDPFFRVGDESNEIGSNYLELGLGLGVDRVNVDQNDQDGENNGFVIEECESEFFVGHRTDSGESFELRTVEDCLRAIGIRSDSDEEEEGIVGVDFRVDDGLNRGEGGDLGIPLCWDCLRLEDQRDSNGEFEWEEVDDRADEREVLSMLIDPDEDISVSNEIHSAEVVEGREEIMRNLEWEVLLAVNNIERNPELEHDIDHEDYIYPAEYEMIFGQFTENENAFRGSPPAAKTFIENLPSIVLTQYHVQNKSAICAVCKDDISCEEQAKLLPCSHYYHGDCILPWLNIRNTCPVCRFELPTDDPEYNRRRA